MTEFRVWITDRARGVKHMPLGEHETIEAAFLVALKRWGSRLVSVRSVPTPSDPHVEVRRP